MNVEKGIICNIQRYSIHDGPGIRTVVFLKGCPLRCRWCGNPESQRKEIELAWNESRCINCGGCLMFLKDYGTNLKGNKLYWKNDTVPNDAKVRRACCSGALHVIGEEKSAEEIIDTVMRDKVFFSNSGGGITLSGGEILLQPNFTLEILRLAKEKHLNTCIETSAFGDTEKLLKIAGYADYMFMDVKAYDDGIHIANTGVSNKLILKNIKAVREAFPELKICIRTPVIPGVNDNKKEITSIKNFVVSLGNNTEFELLRYHRLGTPKYESLHREYPMGDVTLSDILFEQLEKEAQI